MNRPPDRGPSPAGNDPGSDAHVRSVGRTFILALYGAMRNIRMYPMENPVVQKALEELISQTEQLRAQSGDLEFRVSGEFIFVNGTRLLNHWIKK